MRVNFIVHGNEQTGMGHIMRSISLAQAFQLRGHMVTFFSKFEPGIFLLQKADMQVCRIPAEPLAERQGFFYGSPEELERDITAIRKRIIKKSDVLIVDSYNVSSSFFESLRELTNCLVYIDDLNLFPYPIDILVNGTASAFDMGYENVQSAQLLLGTEYNQVRKEFSGLSPKEMNGGIADLLITTGNGDPCHMTEKILGIIMKTEQFSGFRYHVIVGGGFEKDIWFDPNVVNREQVMLYDNPSNMWEIMMKCDIAVSAGGSTLYELAACGVPTIVFAYADNQLLHIKALEREGMLKYLGYYNDLQEERLVKYIYYLMENPDARKKMITKQQALVDGNGCSRIVKKIESFIGENLA